ncbi:ATP-grasp domain-containing protein [Micromonospora sp. NPDC050686]|uniref:ATP-grasp domain-containing protein n=1 Tax=Micromonospora sp. NPDC050686 TaxID=3154631 RepID=UPI0033DD30FD
MREHPADLGPDPLADERRRDTDEYVAFGTADPRPLLLLVNSMCADYREWALRGLHRKFRLWLLDAQEATWDRPYLVGQTTVDALNLDEAIAAAKELSSRQPIAGVLCYDEMRIWAAARIAAALGLPTSTPDAVLACRDKRLTRQRMAGAGAGAVRSIAVADAAGARRAAERIGYPVVLKPRALAGSEGVTRIDRPDLLDAEFAFADGAHVTDAPRFAEGVLVEEYLDGPEITVDSVVRRGEVRPAFISHKEQRLAPTFEETGHVVTADDPLLEDERLREVVQSAHTALGFSHGVTHTEVRLTDKGPRIIEVNGRLGGDMITYVGLLATGIDLAAAAGRLAAGGVPDLTPRRRCTAAVRFYYPPHDMVLEELRLDSAGLPAGIWECTILAGPGQRLLLPPRSFVDGRLAAGFAVGADDAACQHALDELGTLLRVRGRPID